MQERKRLADRLAEYGHTDAYPFHMPGHKRRADEENGLGLPSPFSIDITEIDGFDNLHHPQGILKDSMEWAASVYGADKTYYLVNGSTAGVLSAICGTVDFGGKIVMARNCHKAAYHGVILNHLQTEYIYPQKMENIGVYGGLFTDNIEQIVDKHDDIQAIFVVSPTYEGIVSDIAGIVRVAHGKGIPVIVDEAHGAHFSFGGEDFPASALDVGADVVVQSLHKTLPSLTQTAVLHVKRGLVDVGRMERYLQIFQSSSPSYVLMASIENCIRWMDETGRYRIKGYREQLREFRAAVGGMKHLKVMGDEVVGRNGVYALDPSKILISVKGTCRDGGWLGKTLRERYHLELEMWGRDYGLAMTSLLDTEEGFARLKLALLELDQELGESGGEAKVYSGEREDTGDCALGTGMRIAEAIEAKEREIVLFSESAGRVSLEFVSVYPPGIPMIVPGEMITREIIRQVEDGRKSGLSIEGMRDESGATVAVMAEEKVGAGQA